VEDRKVAAVIASNREDQFREFVDAWYGQGGFPWDVTILVQDGGGPRFKPEDKEARHRWRDLVHYDWATIVDEQEGELPAWLSRRDSGIKAYGFLVAVFAREADVIIALDDDCLPCHLAADPSWQRRKDVDYDALVEAARSGFVEQHLHALDRTRRWATSIPGFVPRGLPYGTDEDGQRQPLIRHNSLGTLPIMLNMGVWATIPDRDAVHELTNWTPEGYYQVWKPQKNVYRHTRVMSPHQYWPMCGMNVAFRREIAPLMYFPRMGEGSPFRRFDDIWCGVIAQKCLRHLGLSCSVGRPIISHTKASRPMDNLVGESPGIRANEKFWLFIEGIRLVPAQDTPLRCMKRVGDVLAELGGSASDELLRGYMPQLGRWILDWCDRFTGAEWEP
jgi:hypothetical protein